MRAVIFLFIFFAAFNAPLFAQNNSDDLKLFDSVSVNASLTDSCEHLLNRLDMLTIETFQKPETVGYLVIHGGRDPVKNNFLERYFVGYRDLRKIDKDRFVILTAKSEGNLRIDFWLSKNGQTTPNVKTELFSFTLPDGEKPIPFMRETVKIVKTDQQWNYLNTVCAACCIDVFNPDFLAEYLKSNPQHNAQIRIYGRSRSHTKILEKLVRDEILKSNISPNRFRISYRGIGKGIAQYPKNYAKIEIEIVPQNSRYTKAEMVLQ